MNQEDARIGTKVIYSFGVKASLFNHKGIIMSPPDQDDIVMVAFEDGNTYPCYCFHLTKSEE